MFNLQKGMSRQKQSTCQWKGADPGCLAASNAVGVVGLGDECFLIILSEGVQIEEDEWALIDRKMQNAALAASVKRFKYLGRGNSSFSLQGSIKSYNMKQNFIWIDCMKLAQIVAVH